MSARRIPTDILSQIIREATFTTFEDVYFKKSLVYLSVCRDWRYSLMPTVYSYAYASCAKLTNITEDNGATMAELQADTAKLDIETNLDLIAASGAVNLVRKVEVNVRYGSLPFLRHYKVATLLKSLSNVWPNVNSLNMAMYVSGFRFNQNHTIEPHAKIINEVGSMFTQTFPGVKWLSVQGTNCNPFARAIYGHIAGAYANQLLWLSSRHPIVVSPECKFTKLNYLNINCDGDASYQLPRIDAEYVKVLKIISGSNNHSWEVFGNKEHAKKIEFTNLHKLSVDYTINSTVNAQVDSNKSDQGFAKLLFPQLKQLNMKLAAGQCPLVLMTEFPANIDMIDIEIPDSTIPQLGQNTLPHTRKLVLDIKSPSIANMDPAIPFVNNLLAKLTDNAVVCLNLPLGIHTNKLDFRNQNIAKLEIDGEVSVSTLLSIFTKLPNLMELKCDRVMMDRTAEKIGYSEVDITAYRNTPLLNTTLKRLSINCECNGRAIALFTLVVKYIMIKLPNLQHMSAVYVPQEQITSFIDEFKQAYPHLSDISLSLDINNGIVYDTDNSGTNYGASNDED